MGDFCKNIPLWKWILLFISGFAIFFFVGALFEGLLFSPEVDSVSKEIIPWRYVVIAVVLSAILLGMYALWIKLTEKRRPSELAPKSLPGWGAAGFFGTMIYFLVIVGILVLFGSYRIDKVLPINEEIWMGLAGFLLIAVFEELVFRGILFRMIWKRWGIWIALLVSSLIFGFAHILNPNATLWSSFAIAIEAGFLLGAAYVVSDNLWLPIAIHWAWNFTQGNICGVPVSGSPTGARIFVPTLDGPEILTGGRFGLEASIVTVILGFSVSAILLAIYYKKKKAEQLDNKETAC